MKKLPSSDEDATLQSRSPPETLVGHVDGIDVKEDGT